MELKHVQAGVVSYLEKELIPKADFKTQFKLWAGIAFANIKLEKMYQENVGKLASMGIVDGQGNIDIDTLYQSLKFAMQRTGKYQVGDIIFNEQDIDKMYEYIKTVGGAL